MSGRTALGRQWATRQPRTQEDLAAQAARVRANNAKAVLPRSVTRELRLETLRADADDN